jgi:hypothetical protein
MANFRFGPQRVDESRGYVYDSTTLSWVPQTAASAGGPGGGSTQVSISGYLDSSNAFVQPGDQVNQALRVNVVAGAAAGSTIVTVSAFGSGLLSSAAAPANSSALNVRVVGHGSSAVDFPVRAVLSSTSADNPVSAAQSGTWNVQIATNLQSSAVANSNSSALNVRVVGHGSSAVDFPVRAVLSSTSTDNPVNAAQAGTWNVQIATNLQSSAVANANSSALNVRIVGGVSSAVDFPVRAVLSSTKADNLISVYQSSAAEFNASVQPIAGSTFRTQPGSTLWASSAGFHFDSSGALQITGAAAGSTDVSITQLRDSSGGSISAGDSLNQALRVNVVAGAAGGSTIVTISSLPLISSAVVASNSSALNVRVVGGVSSAADFNVTVAGYSTIASIANQVRVTCSTATDLLMLMTGLDSSVGAKAVRVAAAAPVGTEYGLLTRTIGPSSVTCSSAADFLVTATIGTNLQSSVTSNSGSSGLNVRIIDGCSSAANFKTFSFNADGLGNAVESSTRAVGVNSTMRGLAVRSVLPAALTAASSNAFTSTSFTIATSNAATVGYIYAYTITSTVQTPTQLSFYAGATLKWPIHLAAISSAVTGVNLSVSPPAYLFAGSTGVPLTLQVDSSLAGYKVGVAYWTE